MLDRLRQGFLHVMGHGASAPPPPQVLDAAEARMVIRQAGDVIEFEATLSAEPILRLRGEIDGPLSTGRASGRSATSLLHLQVPIRADGQAAVVDITVMRPNDDDNWQGYVLARARRRRLPPASQALELLYSNELDVQIRYMFCFDEAIRPLGFQEFSRHESVFKEVPSVSQMVAFLRATLHHRRTTLRSLTSMARNASDARVLARVAEMNERLSQGQDFATDLLRQTLAWLSDQGRTVNPNTLCALALLADIHLGRIETAHVDALVEGGQAIPLSVDGIGAAVAFLGVAREGAPPFLPPADDGARALAFLEATVARRNAISILTDLADDSGSERSRGRVDQLLARVSAEQNLLNDEHAALQSYIQGRGRKIQGETISALAIYVDFEAGILNEEDIDGLTPQRAFVDASLYSMLAISRAFDFELHCWLLPHSRSTDPADQEALWRGLENLVTLSEGGVIARFWESGQAGHQTMHVPTPSDVAEMRGRGYTFTGELLADLPHLAHLQESELGAFEASGETLVARYVSESGTVRWQRLQVAGREGRVRRLPDQRYSFIDRYEIFHFGQSLMGRLEGTEAEALVGREDVLVVYRDARGAAHYKHMPAVSDAAAVATPPQRDWTFDRTTVWFPDARLFPPLLAEASHEYLLGLPDDRASRGRLDLVYSGLEQALAPAPELLSLGALPDLYRSLHEALQAPALRALLLGALGQKARDGMADRLASTKESLRVSPSLTGDLAAHPALLELAALFVLHALFHDDPALEARVFEDLLLDRLLSAAESDNQAERLRAVEWMGTSTVAGREDQRMAFSYVLCRFLESDGARVAAAAAHALGALALRRVRRPPAIVARVEDERPLPASEDSESLADEVLTVFSLPPEHRKSVLTMLAALLPEVASPSAGRRPAEAPPPAP
jgi:hypothetical protein